MNVQRQRRITGTHRRRLRRTLATTVALTVAGSGIAYASSDVFGTNQVGSDYAGGLQVSDNQLIKPIGDRLKTDNGKIMGSSVSPNGRFVAASSADKKVALQIFDLTSYKLVWSAGTAAGVNQKFSDLTVGQEAPTFSPDGTSLWLSLANSVARFPVNADGSLGTPTTVPLAKDGAKSALPGKVAFSADGNTAYVPLNGQNKVVALDATNGSVQRSWAVGIAPRQVALVGDHLYVSNEGGRPAKAGDTTINSYGTDVPADGYLGTSTNGTVSVIDTASDAAPSSIDVGLHPTALYVKGKTLFVANTNSDTVSVVDTTKNAVVQTIATQPYAASKVGYQPTSIAVTDDNRLLVTLSRANAVAVYQLGGTPQEPVSDLGLLPTDYYPASVAVTGGKVVVTNTRGIDARGPALTYNKGQGTTPATGHGTHSTTASLTRFAMPATKELKNYTRTVFQQNGWGKNDAPVARGNKQAAVPVPARVGDPSTIKHVFVLVKENRTYDQVYGDMKNGNGDASLAQFGKTVTPNQHALANQFGLYDNTYDIGTNSAEGHNWLMQGDNPEYTESSAGQYIRSYDTEDDVLGHQRSGFLWTSAMSAGNSAKNFGEFLQFEQKPAGATWQKYYCAAKSVDEGGDPAQLTTPDLKTDNSSPIPSLNKITVPTAPKFDTQIPDLYRYGIWKNDFEKNGPANLNMMWLSSDHTGGTPDPRAQVADGDVAVGKIVDTISHSKFWKDSAIFVVEDDSQDGADHVDGHRAPIQVISPYAAHGKTVSTFYSQLNMIRTIQQIMGAAPLNQKLAAATPMFDAFTRKPDFTPFTARKNEVPLTEGVATAPACGSDTVVGAAAKPAIPAAAQSNAAQWEQWRQQQKFTGANPVPDSANPAQMNRYTWYQAHNWTIPYPGDPKLYAPTQVPGAFVPNPDNE
ncbi:bifunctional YncE family protein/alkaline phosphatase family protein [Calidifontibacter terrae]